MGREKEYCLSQHSPTWGGRGGRVVLPVSLSLDSHWPNRIMLCPLSSSFALLHTVWELMTNQMPVGKFKTKHHSPSLPSRDKYKDQQNLRKIQVRFQGQTERGVLELWILLRSCSVTTYFPDEVGARELNPWGKVTWPLEPGPESRPSDSEPRALPLGLGSHR